MKKVLITGGSGLFATNCAQICNDSYKVVLLLHRRKIAIEGIETDVALIDTPENVFSVFRKHKPDIVIHAAGLTSVEDCENDPKGAEISNVETTRNVSLASNYFGASLVHISTDHIFSGLSSYSSEIEKGNPVNIYAKTKLKAEEVAIENNPNALIIRTNFFGWGSSYRESFSDFIIKNLRQKKEIKLFKDIFFTPVVIDVLVEQIFKLLEKKAKGIFNIASSERLSKFEFGMKLASRFNLDFDLIKPVSIENQENLVKRPFDMSLSNSKVTKLISSSCPTIDEQIAILFSNEAKRSRSIKRELIPYGKHFIDQQDIDSVVDVLNNGLLTQGPKIQEFEKKVKEYVGAKYAVAVSSATAALHLSAIVLDFQVEDKVITSPNTFVATSNSILYVGAEPLFVDINEETLNIDEKLIEQKISQDKNIKAIYPVHFAGLPCNMEKIYELAKKYSLKVVEDASHALGARYEDNSRVGNCRYSDLTVFSFHPVKGIAAGEGGMITTNNEELYHKLLLLRSHGITKGNFEFPGVSIPDNSLINKDEALENEELKRWYYEMQYLGYNYRLTDIQCALAISQMNKIDLFLETRRSIAKFYDKAFSEIPNITPLQLHGRNNSSHHIYIVSIDFKKILISKHEFMKKLAEQGVGSQVHYIPVVCQPYYQVKGYRIEQYPSTSQHYENTLSLPLYYGLSNADQKLVVSSIINLLR